MVVVGVVGEVAVVGTAVVGTVVVGVVAAMAGTVEKDSLNVGSFSIITIRQSNFAQRRLVVVVGGRWWWWWCESRRTTDERTEMGHDEIRRDETRQQPRKQEKSTETDPAVGASNEASPRSLDNHLDASGQGRCCWMVTVYG